MSDLHVYDLAHLDADLKTVAALIQVPSVGGEVVTIPLHIYKKLVTELNVAVEGGYVVDPRRHYTLIWEEGETLPSKALMNHSSESVDLNFLRRQLLVEADEMAELLNETSQQAKEDFYVAVKTVNSCPYTESLLFV